MKKLLLAIGILAVFACQHEIEPLPSPADASRIEGDWVAMIPNQPNWHYHFHSGVLTREVFAFSGESTVYTHDYVTKDDSIFISNSHTWLVWFQSEDVVRISDVEAQLYATKWLKRE